METYENRRCQSAAVHRRRRTNPAQVVKLSVAILAAGLLLAPALPARECDRILVRVGIDENSELTVVGSELILPVGQTTTLHLQVKSKILNQPYSTNASLGFPSDYGFDEYPHDEVSRLLTIAAQTSEDRSAGRLELSVNQSGFGALGYRLDGIAEPGDIEKLEPICRLGVIPFHAVDFNDRLEYRAEDAGLERFQAADELVQRLLGAATGQPPNSFYPKKHLDRVYEDGFGGMTVVLAEALSSARSKSSSSPVSGFLSERLLEALLGHHDSPFETQGLAAASRACSLGTSAIDCLDLAQLLISSERFRTRHADLLRYFSKDFGAPSER